MSFESELAEGFSELAAEAGTGTALSFGGVALVGVLDVGSEDRTRTDTQLGPPPKRLQLMVARSALNALAAWPKVGDSFAYGAQKLNVKEVLADDPTDPMAVFVVKRV